MREVSRGSSEVERGDCNPEGGQVQLRPPGTILAGHQPVFLPGIIVMAKIAAADKFMFVGHCEYQAKSWHSRNFIRGDKGTISAINVPIVRHRGKTIDEVQPLPGEHWRRKILGRIVQAYCNRPFFKLYFGDIRNHINTPARSL